jgi:hypothetical protein
LYFSVISDFGGLLGLFMGCSLLSIIEVFYFAVNAFLSLFLTRQMPEKQASNSTTSNSSKEFQKVEQKMIHMEGKISQELHEINKRFDLIESKIEQQCSEMKNIKIGSSRKIKSGSNSLKIEDLC